MENLYVRIYGKLVHVSKVSLVQLGSSLPGKDQQIVQELPLSKPLEKLMNIHAALKPTSGTWSED